MKFQTVCWIALAMGVAVASEASNSTTGPDAHSVQAPLTQQDVEAAAAPANQKQDGSVLDAEAAKETLSNAADALANAAGDAKDAVVGAAGDAKDAAADAAGAAADVAKNAGEAVAQGASDAANAAKGAVEDIKNAAPGVLASTLALVLVSLSL